MGVQISQGERAIFRRCPGHSKALAIFAASVAAALAANGIIQSPIAKYSTMQQKGSFRMPAKQIV